MALYSNASKKPYSVSEIDMIRRNHDAWPGLDRPAPRWLATYAMLMEQNEAIAQELARVSDLYADRDKVEPLCPRCDGELADCPCFLCCGKDCAGDGGHFDDKGGVL